MTSRAPGHLLIPRPNFFPADRCLNTRIDIRNIPLLYSIFKTNCVKLLLPTPLLLPPAPAQGVGPPPPPTPPPSSSLGAEGEAVGGILKAVPPALPA